MMKKSRRYTKEEIALANSYSLPDLLRRSGYILDADRRGEYHLREHDSLKISEHNGWKWFSRDVGGKNIDFFMQYEGLDFLSAVEKIFNITGDMDVKEAVSKKDATIKPETRKAASEPAQESRELRLPEKNENNKRAFAYLVKTRCLDPRLVKNLLDTGHVYEAANTHNAVFVGTDYEGNVVSAFERGTGTKKFARDSSGSNKSYRFRITTPRSEKVNVFEAEIDMLSYISMNGVRAENYIALGGLSPLALDTFLSESGQKIGTVNICLDNDAAGITAAELLENQLKERGFEVTREFPVGKDFNEDLQNKTLLRDSTEDEDHLI